MNYAKVLLQMSLNFQLLILIADNCIIFTVQHKTDFSYKPTLVEDPWLNKCNTFELSFETR